MYFKSTYFHSFRNLHGERRLWRPGFNLIAGPNGAGKTNFLEGLNIVSGWGPLERGTKMPTLVRWSNDDARVRGRASLWAGVAGEEEAEIFASLSARSSLKYGDKSCAAGEMRARMPVLTCLSDHMAILRGGAAHRRQLLDRVGSLVLPLYAVRLHDYRRALRQKAALLRRCADPRVADRVLMPLGAWLWSAREEIVRRMSDALGVFSNLLARPMTVSFVRGGGGLDENPAQDFRRALLSKRDRERAARIPMVGPQRDDICLACGERSAAESLSRGQSRRAASALILSAALLVERVLARRPVLIFDEVTAELDSSGRDAMLEALISTGYQIFAATTDPIVHEGVHIFHMQDGQFL